MKRIVNAITDLFPVVLALVFVVVIILTVCHATTSLQDAVKQSSLQSQPEQTRVQRDQPKPDKKIENAVQSGELEMLVSPIVP